MYINNLKDFFFVSDIPMSPAFSSSDLAKDLFVLHWMNNKEMHFTMRIEQLLEVSFFSQSGFVFVIIFDVTP